MPNTKEILEEEGLTKEKRAEVLAQFVDKLAEEDEKVFDKLTVFLANLPKKQLPLTGITLSEEVKLYFVATMREGAVTLNDALQCLREIAPEHLCKLMEAHLLKETGVSSLTDIDAESVYDDVAMELDVLEEDYGGDTLLSDLLKAK